MKPKHAVIFAIALLVAGVIVSGSQVILSSPRYFRFLDRAELIDERVEDDGGLIGAEVRVFAVPERYEDVLANVRAELLKQGFKASPTKSGEGFLRGRAERVDLMPATDSKEMWVLNEISVSDRPQWTVAKVRDPRARRHIRQTIVELLVDGPGG